MEKNELTLRSSAAEFLIFEKQSHADSVDVIYQDGTLWMSQRMMGILFDVEPNTITYHLGEIYKIGELEEGSTHRKIRVVQTEGTRSDDRDILTDAGKISMEIAKDHAESEYEKYRIIQDRLFESDFDRLILESKKEKSLRK